MLMPMLVLTLLISMLAVMEGLIMHYAADTDDAYGVGDADCVGVHDDVYGVGPLHGVNGGMLPLHLALLVLALMTHARSINVLLL